MSFNSSRTLYAETQLKIQVLIGMWCCVVGFVVFDVSKVVVPATFWGLHTLWHMWTSKKTWIFNSVAVRISDLALEASGDPLPVRFCACNRMCSLSIVMGTACTVLMSIYQSFQDVCGHLLMCGDTEVVKKLLSSHTMSKLWPLVLLHVWKNFSDRDEIFVVVSFVIEQCKVIWYIAYQGSCLIVMF